MVHAWLGVRSDGRWSSPRCGLAVPRQNGKNGALEIRELYGMVVRGERFLHTAHEVKTARKAFARLLSFFDNPREHPELAALVSEVRRTNGQEAIVLHNGGSVEFIARSKGSGRGFSVDVLVLDEAQELSEDALAALLPTISASANAQQILTGTPPSPTATGDVFTRMREAGNAGTDFRLCWLEWSVDEKTDGVDLDDPQHVAAANPAYGTRLHAETIGDERAVMDDETYARERLGMWGGKATVGVITPEAWLAVADSTSQVEGPVAVAVDVAPMGRSASIAIAGRRPDGLFHVEVIKNQRGTDWIGSALVSLSERLKPVAIVMDQAGPAGSILLGLTEQGLEVDTTTGPEMGRACGGLLDGITNGTVRHIDQPVLSASVVIARKRTVGDAWAWHRRDAVSDLTPLVSVTLALWGFQQFASKPRKSRRAYSF